jgi:type III secretion system FlhB-like substrate exporter
MYNILSSNFEPMYTAMTKSYDFTCAELQWDKDVRQKLRDERRPANSYNLIRTILNVIFSVANENKRKGTAKPRTGGDIQLAKTITQVLDYFLYQAKFSRQQKRVMMDAVVAKYGVYGLNWDYKNDPEGTLEIFSCDPREFMFEPNFADPLWSNASYLMRKYSLTLEEILNQFALNDEEMQNEILAEAKQFFAQDTGKTDKWVSKKLKALFSAVYETATGFSSSDNQFKNFLQWWNPSTGKFDILEFHEQRTERRLLVPSNDGKNLVDITDPYIGVLKTNKKDFDGIRFNDNEAVDLVKQNYSLINEPRIDLQNRRFLTATVPSFRLKLNEQAYPFDSKYYIYIPQYCYDLHADPLKAQSVMDDLLDPQAHFNKAQSLKLELLGRYANKGWIMDENAISGLEEDWSSQRIAPYRRVRAGYINMIKPEEGQTISPDLIRDPLETQSLMKVISNADDEVRGVGNAEVKSGKHFIAKERQQSKSFSYIFDNRDATQAAVLEMSLNFIQHFVKSQRVFRITQDVKEPYDLVANQSQYSRDQNTGNIVEQVVNDLDAAKYDVELSDAPYSSSVQEERYGKLSDAFNAALSVSKEKADAMLPIIIEEGMPEVSDKILEAWNKIGQPSEQQAQLSQMMQQLQMILAKLGVEEKKEEVTSKKLQNLETMQRVKRNAKQNVLGNLSSGVNQQRSYAASSN